MTMLHDWMKVHQMEFTKKCNYCGSKNFILWVVKSSNHVTLLHYFFHIKRFS